MAGLNRHAAKLSSEAQEMNPGQIWKFPLHEESNPVEVEMPEGAKVLHVGTQYNQTCLWAHVNPDRGAVNRKFHVYGTGHQMHIPVGEYLGTTQTHEGAFVWHVYDVTEC